MNLHQLQLLLTENPMELLLLYITNVLEKHFCKCDTYEDYKSYISEKKSESGPIPVAIPVFKFCSYVCLLETLGPSLQRFWLRIKYNIF